MNYNKELYPTDLQELLIKANNIADIITQKLNDYDCLTLSNLYEVKSGKTYRKTELWNNLGYGPSPDTKNVNEGKTKNEYKGIYVFGEVDNNKVTPVYVGISRTIYRRLRQHGWGKKHNECSLGYLMAKKNNVAISRANIHINFDEELILKKEKVKSFKVALFPVEKDYELYFLEVALAGKLKTKWNSFRTH